MFVSGLGGAVRCGAMPLLYTVDMERMRSFATNFYTSVLPTAPRGLQDARVGASEREWQAANGRQGRHLKAARFHLVLFVVSRLSSCIALLV